MQKYIGRTIEIIYLDRHGRFTQRRIRVYAVRDQNVIAYDIDRQVVRTFRIDGVMAMQPVMSA